MSSLRGWLLQFSIVFTSTIYSGKSQNFLYYGYGPPSPWTGAASYPAQVSIDVYGNCQAHDRPLAGRCVRYGDCISAIRSARQVTPLLCPSPWPEQLVCCPHGGYVKQAPRLRKSEEACLNAYPRGHHKRRRRRRHSNNSNQDQLAVVEPTIQRGNQSENLLVGGRFTLPNEYPYMCALGWPSRTDRWIRGPKFARRRYTFNCGCVMISGRFALTAAHCANVGGEPPSVALIGGGDLNDSRGQLIEIRDITKHPHFDEESLTNDLAVVKLARRSNMNVACLWSHDSVPESPFTALGYGQTKFAGPHSNELLQVMLYPLDIHQCQRFMQPDDKLKNGLGPGHLCAGDYAGNMDTCQVSEYVNTKMILLGKQINAKEGDSGGPLIYHQNLRHHHHTRIPYVVGITSFGGACATGQPGVYMRIEHYLQWIEEQVWS